MKRNVATILKYLIFAALLLTLGPLLMKMMIGDGPPIRQRNRDTHHFGLAKGAGPVDPEDLNKIFESVSMTRLDFIKMPSENFLINSNF